MIRLEGGMLDGLAIDRRLQVGDTYTVSIYVPGYPTVNVTYRCDKPGVASFDSVLTGPDPRTRPAPPRRRPSIDPVVPMVLSLLGIAFSILSLVGSAR